jgi:hypothetical protein
LPLAKSIFISKKMDCSQTLLVLPIVDFGSYYAHFGLVMDTRSTSITGP